MKPLFLLIAIGLSLGINAQNKTLNYQSDCHVANAGGQYTSIATAPNGDIYSAWMDANRNLKLLKITSTNTKDSIILRTNLQTDKYHVKPSIAFDKLGYLHIAADMHNQDWVYYRSRNPYDMAAGFDVVTPPCNLISYPNFFKDKNDELYVAFRHKVKLAPSHFSVGSSGGGVLKYDAVSKTFTMLGGTDHGLLKTLVWVNMGGAGTLNGDGSITPNHYQQPNIRLFFDNTNRMHLVCTLINQPTTGASDANTHVLYAYSDDGGNTFYRVDGSLISSYPMGPSNMSVVLNRTEADILADSYIGAFNSNSPIISWQKVGGGGKVLKWNGSAWQELVWTGGNIATGRQLASRRNGETLFFAYPFNYFLLSKDNGATFQRTNITPTFISSTSIIIDNDYYNRTGNIRFQHMNSAETQVYLNTIQLVIVPVELSSFLGSLEDGKVLLKWRTSSEINTKMFVIERLNRGNIWEKIGSVAASGNASKPIDYNFTDTEPLSMNYYRLKTVDRDDAFTYSKTIALEIPQNEINSILYEPSAKQIVVNSAQNVKFPIDYYIYNQIGQVIQTGKIRHILEVVDISHVSSGLYVFNLSDQRRIKFAQF